MASDTASGRRRRRWPWVLGVLGVIAIASSTMLRQAREAREARYATVQRDSARRADSLRKVEQARTDSVNSAVLVGGMVDTLKSAEQLRADSITTANKALQAPWFGGAPLRPRSRVTTSRPPDRFPTPPRRNCSRARARFDLKFSVRHRAGKLSMNNPSPTSISCCRSHIDHDARCAAR
jgi:hypothetical protein